MWMLSKHISEKNEAGISAACNVSKGSYSAHEDESHHDDPDTLAVAVGKNDAEGTRGTASSIPGLRLSNRLAESVWLLHHLSWNVQ
jgi:hypothetical protein